MVNLLFLKKFGGTFAVFEKNLVVHLLFLKKFGGTFVVLKILVVNLLF